MIWFECKISYEKIMENGVQRKVTEPYLVDALSHAEAEARIIEEIQPYISGEFTVTSVRRAKYAEIFQVMSQTIGGVPISPLSLWMKSPVPKEKRT
ncbi:hypothetical protein M2138_000179 [Dysgonomonadaceae bacterium PH5-43]|nr:hypothetical protein [Dysgonomonadaceae bacterium PH5-43]